MPALTSTEHTARITWLGRVADSTADLRSASLQDTALTFAGMPGEFHGGETRPACSRVAALYPRGTVIANTRQLSIVSTEELAQIAQDMGLEALDPRWIGASMVVEGIADFSHLPPSSRLQGPDGASMVVDMQNRPCLLPAKVIEAECPGKGRAFKRAAEGRRGVTAWVEREGRLALGDTVRLFIPDQRAWALQG
ncbi:MOSC domain-containing protein [Roseovarius sp. M141]|uniref:MOSC domain-containing protein n=1 Tax=Roseovarius sp. M141 TaxID=2583806 RepID=UPI0020CF18EB|nr:MOSC domain-containing protein [Roseovarius sp. M141]MCQ0092108.1 MOSC domain-containing protein [Roseovarius sp. M141]